MQIKNNFSFHVKEKFFFHFANGIEIKKLTQGINSKQVTGIETIPLKLIEVAADFLTPLLTKPINSSIEHNIFPDSSETILVFPLHKGTSNENYVSYFRPVSILNTFPKIYEGYKKPITS